ncbi:hypothetical protein [Neorhizobium galegae]|uniref:hypothetical protein n=1 Tax=Neorhizobium galegae TaxID=399 RepID=UPI001F1F3B6D|nr:hypothetical protein [Neorhizobium galegae]UIK04789.1 hypothetical protein LZK81_19310 [Neorhizobium galegae]
MFVILSNEDQMRGPLFTARIAGSMALRPRIKTLHLIGEISNGASPPPVGLLQSQSCTAVISPSGQIELVEDRMPSAEPPFFQNRGAFWKFAVLR